MTTTYREGPVGALMDEYERAANELKKILQEISQSQFTIIVDPDTKDPDCHSIQTIMNHVVRSGYGYANYIRKKFGDTWRQRKTNYEIHSPKLACQQLDEMLNYTLETLENKWNISYDQVVKSKMKTTWGQEYDFEQLLEHAIVHILRHRRQIEKFILKLKA